MSSGFQTIKYLTERMVKQKINHPIHVRILAIRTSDPMFPLSFSVEEIGSTDNQPCWIEANKTLVDIFENSYGPKGYFGKCFEITKLPRKASGKPFEYKVSEIKKGEKK